MKTRIVSMICGLVMTIPLATNAQNHINGTVKNEVGETLFGAKIAVEESFLGAYTDVDGNFQIDNVEDGKYVVVFTLAGYDDIVKEVQIAGKSVQLNIELLPSAQRIEEVMVQSIRADEKTPTTYTNLDKKRIEQSNYGQDLPYLLGTTPSTVVTSDAGAGVGYTGIRIRGVDPTRTNVTINGIPLNDSESHGVFWVNMPDFASSVQNIQVQRGIGTSSNGATAFGASINIQTDDVHKKAYAVLDNGYGSFNTWRHTVMAGTGLIKDHFTVDARLSKISSDGYVDRAASDLKSFYLSAAWLGKNASLRANIFSGKEKTYQAWYGTPESVINGSEEEITAYADRNWIFGEDRDNLLNSGRTYNYYTYENEVDNYQQDHYQLLYSQKLLRTLNLDVAAHYTRGRGYYEQFRPQDDLSDYGLDPVIFTNDTVLSSDIIRRRWLDNHFYGGIFSLNYKKKGLDLTLGGGANNYEGGHYGEIIWAEHASNSSIRQKYYDNDSYKFEAHAYLKGTYQIKKITAYADVQYRHIDYKFLGIDDVNGVIEAVNQTASYDFVNPKVGLMVDFNSRNNAYASFAMANREPVRSDFRENTPENRPDHEQLMNIEAGYRYKGRRLFVNANVYLMDYKNQLVLTGQINDVGGYTRTNVDKSTRMGVEIEAGYQIFRNLSVSGNFTLSSNKVKTFNEYVDNYDVGGQDTITHNNTDLAFSPSIIASLGIGYKPVKGLEISLRGKYVGEQYLDNTSNGSVVLGDATSYQRKIDDYFVTNLNISYTLKDLFFKEITIGFQINNLFDQKYVNNGYTWGYVAGTERTVENFYYAQAGRNFMTRLTIKL
ncbi:MAG: TonB-dependent receptor [Crocinitomicaceae bacterium]|nr:TonB-dependent receptor [Crocinitomicaceae bacterium]